MSPLAVPIRHVVRRMRGGSQSFLVQCEDGCYYVAKFASNPQGTRTLINEWIAQRLLLALPVSTPTMRLLRLDTAIRDAAANELYFSLGNERRPIPSGLHLGSQCPVDPSAVAIFDFLPRKLFPLIVNLKDFVTMYVFHIMLGHIDSCQAIFVRDRSQGSRPCKYRAYMIDHGMTFSGTEWRVHDGPVRPYFDRTVYSLVDLGASCEQAVKLVSAAVTEGSLAAAFEEVPREWLSRDDFDHWRSLVALFRNRPTRLHGLVWRQLEAARLGAVLPS